MTVDEFRNLLIAPELIVLDVADAALLALERALEEFFVIASRMSGKSVKIDGWEGPRAAEKLIDKAAKAYMRGGAVD